MRHIIVVVFVTSSLACAGPAYRKPCSVDVNVILDDPATINLTCLSWGITKDHNGKVLRNRKILGCADPETNTIIVPENSDRTLGVEMRHIWDWNCK